MAVTVKKKSAGKVPKKLPPSDTKTQATILLTHDALVSAVKEAIGIVTVEHEDGSVTTAQEVIAAISAKAPMANVGVSGGATIATAKFENVKIGVMINIPCAITEDDFNETFTFAKSWIDSKMGELME